MWAAQALFIEVIHSRPSLCNGRSAQQGSSWGTWGLSVVPGSTYTNGTSRERWGPAPRRPPSALVGFHRKWDPVRSRCRRDRAALSCLAGRAGCSVPPPVHVNLPFQVPLLLPPTHEQRQHTLLFCHLQAHQGHTTLLCSSPPIYLLLIAERCLCSRIQSSSHHSVLNAQEARRVICLSFPPPFPSGFFPPPSIAFASSLRTTVRHRR